MLLHSGKVTEAVTWFRQHMNAYKRLVGAPDGIFLHWEWMSRQFLVVRRKVGKKKNTIFKDEIVISMG